MSNLFDVHNDQEFQQALSKAQNLVALDFWAEWAEPSVQMKEVFDELSKKHANVTFIKVEAENVEASDKYNVEAVPTFVLLKSGKVVETIDGANAPELTQAIAKFAKSAAVVATPVESTEDKQSQLDKRIDALLSKNDVMLFMKGVPSQPRCGFSRQVVELLQEQGVNYGYFNILADEDVRQRLKEKAEWPTYPMLFVKGELVGGLDIIKELIESGEFKNMLPAEESLDSKLKKLVNKAPVMLFMKGVPDAPKCGFSRTIVGLLNDAGVKFDSFNILDDDDVRQGLKTFSNWPTYPQLYIGGELVGGLDIVKELIESGEFTDMIPK